MSPYFAPVAGSYRSPAVQGIEALLVVVPANAPVRVMATRIDAVMQEHAGAQLWLPECACDGQPLNPTFTDNQRTPLHWLPSPPNRRSPMPRTAAVDRPDFHAWRAYRAVVDAEAAAVQVAVFHFAPEGRGRHSVWIHGGPTTGVRIGAVLTTTVEYSDPASGTTRRRRAYTAVADAVVANGTTSAFPPAVEGLDSRCAAAALLYGRWIERRTRLHAAANLTLR